MKVRVLTVTLFEPDGVTPKASVDVVYNKDASDRKYWMYPVGDYTASPLGKSYTSSSAVEDLFRYQEQILFKLKAYSKSE